MYSGPLLDGGEVGVVSSEVEEQLDRNTTVSYTHLRAHET